MAKYEFQRDYRGYRAGDVYEMSDERATRLMGPNIVAEIGAGGGGGPIPDPLQLGAFEASDHVSIDAPAAAASGTYEGDGDPDAAIHFVAVTPGAAGNDLAVHGQSDAETEPLSVAVDGNDINVSLETSGSFDSLSTAQEIIDAINADPEASLLVVASLAPGSDGSGIVQDGNLDLDLLGGGDAGNISFTGRFSEPGEFLTDDGSGQIIGTVIQLTDVNQLTEALALRKIVYKFTYSFDIQGGAVGTIPLVGVVIPAGFVATHSWIMIYTPLAGGAGATASLGTEGLATNLVPATVVSDPPWSTSGPKTTLNQPSANGFAASGTPEIVVAVNALTAGIFTLMIEGIDATL